MASPASTLSGAARDPSAAIHDIKQKGLEEMNKAASSLEDVAGKVVEHGREAGERVQEVAGTVQSAVTQSLRDQPLATLAVVAAVGFVLGAIWKS